MCSAILKLMFLPTLLFMVVIGFIRAQPYNDHGVQALLSPTDECAAPCFLGIEPGVTPIDTVLARLEASEWIEDVEIFYGNTLTSTGNIRIQWTWSGQQPAYINGDVGGRIAVSPNGVVLSIVVFTHTQLADWFLYQRPDILVSMSGRHDVLHMVGYGQQQVLLSVNTLPCLPPVEQLEAGVWVELGWSMPRNTRLVLNLLEHPTLYDLEFCQ